MNFLEEQGWIDSYLRNNTSKGSIKNETFVEQIDISDFERDTAGQEGNSTVIKKKTKKYYPLG